MTHTYYASTIGIPTTVLIEEAIRDARNAHGGERHDWKLDYVNEYYAEVLEEDEKTGQEKVVDVEAKVIVRNINL